MNASLPHPQPKTTIVDQVAVHLRDRILAGKIRPGAALREEELAGEYKASRHVIREALRLLAADRLAEYVPFRGARVPQVGVSEIAEIYRARRFLEGSAMTCAAIFQQARLLERLHSDFLKAVGRRDWRKAFQADAEFHATIVAASGSKWILAWHRDLVRGLSLAHLVAPAFDEHGFKESVAEHEDIVAALRAGDADRARVALVSHLEQAERLLIDQIAAGAQPAN